MPTCQPEWLDAFQNQQPPSEGRFDRWGVVELKLSIADLATLLPRGASPLQAAGSG